MLNYNLSLITKMTIGIEAYSVPTGTRWTFSCIDVRFQRSPQRNSPHSKVYYHVHKRPPLVVFQNQINPVHVIPSYYFIKSHFNMQLPHTPSFPNAQPSSRFLPPKFCMYLSSHLYVLRAVPTSCSVI